MIRHYQSIATRKGIAIWLEATTAYSKGIYAKLGLQVVEEMVLGKGRAAIDGTNLNGGEGVRIWGMLWRPILE